jgi:glucose dehydrogenase
MPPPLKERDMWGVTPFDQMLCRIDFKSMRYDGAFTPPSLQGSIVLPRQLRRIRLGWHFRRPGTPDRVCEP